MLSMAELKSEFWRRYGSRPRVFRAPGRVNLIGEHTDYNAGFVMPAAIGFATRVAIASRPDRGIRASSRVLNETCEFSLDNLPAPQRYWGDYVGGVALTLEQAGWKLRGADLLIDSDVPLGAGLSSSAALEVSVAQALLANAAIQLPPLEIARLCQQAESEFVGIRCGIMDQFVSCFGETGKAIMLDCRSLEYETIPMPPGISLVISNTMVRHQLAASEYNLRRADCEQAAALLEKQTLREITPAEFSQKENDLPEQLRKRARHIISENARVLNAAQALIAGDYATFGKLMNESHESLRADYEVSCPELDLLVSLARDCPGVYGSRMTGGGFGGCSISFVQDEHVEAFSERIRAGYQAAMQITPDIYVCTAAQGAAEITIDD